MKSNILFDFKRSFLRISVLSFLALFVIAGVSFTYGFLHTIPQAEFNDVNVAVIVENTTSGYHFLGLVFDNQGNPISNANVTVVCPNSTKVFYTNSSGYFSFYGKPTKIVVTHNGQQKSITLIDTYISHYFRIPRYITSYISSYANVSKFYNSVFLGIYRVYALIIGYNGNTAKVITLVPNVTFYFYNTTNNITFPPSKNIVVGNVTIAQPMKIYTITIPKGTLSVYASYTPKNGRGADLYDLFYSIPPTEHDFLSYVGGSSFISFTFAFSIIFIYVAYQMFGKLKERGLTMLLARPITRGEIYFIRYFSGVLALILATLIFSLASSTIFAVYTGVLPTFPMIIIFAYLFFYIIVWYSLSYLIFSKFSSITALGLSIAIFFAIGFILPFRPQLVLESLFPGNSILYFYPATLSFSLLSYSSLNSR